MTNYDGNGVAECDPDDLILDVSDDALERAASVADGNVTTWGYCTQAWYNCGWPL
jgi:hypothetical protein